MTTACPIVSALPTLGPTDIPNARIASAATPGSWRYSCGGYSRPMLIAAMLVSAGLHAALLYGIGKHRRAAVVAPKEELLIALMAMPKIQDLEEPETIPSDETAPLDLAMPVPMQADLPQLQKPNDFVQPINFASLLEQPDFTKLNVYVIPEHIRSGSGKIAEGIGKIFNLEDLDRFPEPILQPAPMYPVAMRREAVTATVRVEFIVTTDGRVFDAVIVESTHHAFDAAAVAGVSKWKFRPGSKSGHKVNTRMGVPIVFRFSEEIE